MSNNATTPEPESLRSQLTELNTRTRWYSSQLWQVPFAYLGISGLTIASAADKASPYIPFVFWACAIFGMFVFVHTIGMRDGEHRAVRNLQQIEDALHLEQTAQYKHATYAFPLQVALILAVLIYVVAGYLAW